ncbi:MAG: GNAT family N-acetyltransferase [Actinobacteria bacterium]|nr:GNAT family N-acetyltransferase [Actinomycetota bacterium]
MARTRLFVALLPAPAQWEWLDELRRALGVGEPFRIPPHITLVPPTNVAEVDIEVVDQVLVAAAESAEPFDLTLGPAATFAPVTPTIQLSVDGDLVALGRLRQRLMVGPLARSERRPFVPHVTLVPSAEQARIDAALTALAGVATAWPVGSVHVLERHHDPGRWVTVAEVPLGAPRVVGRGTRPAHLRTLRMIPVAVGELCHVAARGPAGRADDDVPIVVVAEGEPGDGTGSLVGAAVGVVGRGGTELRSLVVAPAERGFGLGARLLAEWCSQVGGSGITWASAVVSDEQAASFLVRHGFSLFDGAGKVSAVRRL